MIEVVHTAGPEQRGFQSFTHAQWRARALQQSQHAGAQCRVQPLGICRVDAAQFHLRHLHRRFGAGQAALREPAHDAFQPSSEVLLDNLHDMQIFPDHQRQVTTLAIMQWVMKHCKRAVTGMAEVTPFGMRMDGSRGACATIGLEAYYHFARMGGRVYRSYLPVNTCALGAVKSDSRLSCDVT